MAEAIHIPSPSVFLRDSPPPPLPVATSKPVVKNARRSSPPAETKKKAQRKDSGNLNGGLNNGADGSVVKPKQSKSRNGCLTCKAKRLKCGEEKPGCQQCSRRNVECGGYKKDFKWRPFEETNVKVNIDKQKRGNSPNQFLPLTAKPTTPVSNTSSQKQDAERAKSGTPDEKNDSPVDNQSAFAIRTRPIQRPSPFKGKKGIARYDQKQTTPSTTPLASPIKESFDAESRPARLLPEDFPPSTSGPTSSINVTDLFPGSLAHLAPGLGHSTEVTDLLWPWNQDDPMHQDFVSFELPEGFQVPMLDEDEIDPRLAGDDLGDDGIDEIVNGPLGDVPFLSPDDLSLSPQSAPGSPGQILRDRESLGYIYPQPFFAEDSPEMLTFRFDKLTCGILSVIDGPTENPWRNLIWPLAQQSPALYHAITAMTAFHSSSDVPRLRRVGIEHKLASLQYISEGIRDESFSDQTAIATALALGFAEAWEQHTATGNTHIKGAQVLVKRAIENHRQNPVEGVELRRLKFLCNAWVYMDVIARLTSVDSDESNDFDNTFLFSGNSDDGPSLIMGDTDPGFGIDFGMPVDTRLDPLMGCANTLFPLIGRVANLVRRVCRTQVNSPAIISQANDLKIALESWDPPAFIERPEDPTTDVQHTLQTAEAYRWATLLHLHSAVPELPSLSSSELAQRVLMYLATVPLASRTVIVQIYPLMVAGCEAKTDEDRQWVQNRWSAMNARMRIGVIEKSATVTEEVWRRRDTYEAQPTSNRKLVATADLQPKKERSQPPLVRSPTGTLRLGDPGRTGMVFSYVETDNGRESDDDNPKNKRGRERSAGRDPRMGVMDPAYTVRGHLHWVGVMWNWGWEILLG